MRINRAVACFLCFSQPECAPCLVELCLRCSASPAAGERLAGVHIAHTAHRAHREHCTHSTLDIQHMGHTARTSHTAYRTEQRATLLCTPALFANGLRQAGCVNLSQIYRLHLHYRKPFSVISGDIWTLKTQLMFLVQSLQPGHIMCSIVYMNLGKFVQSEC